MLFFSKKFLIAAFAFALALRAAIRLEFVPRVIFTDLNDKFCFRLVKKINTNNNIPCVALEAILKEYWWQPG